jgi:signal transduction histidine kinase
MRERRPSVYTKVVLFIALVCVTLTGLDLRQNWTSRDARLLEARTETGNLARSLAQHAQDVFETADAAVKTLSDTVVDEGTDQAAIQRLDRRMHARVANQHLFHTLFLYDERGNWLANSHAAADFDTVRNLNYADRAFFRYHREHNDIGALISPPFRTKLDGAWVVTLSRRINHPDGRFGGVIGAAIGLDLFQRYFETFDVGKRGAVTLTSGQGTVLVRTPFDETNIGRNLSEGEFFQKIAAGATAGAFEFTSLIDGTPRFGSFRRVAGFNLIMAVALDTKEVLAGWWHETTVHLMWLAMTIFAILILGHRLTRQIRDRVAAEIVAQKLQIEADQRRGSEAERMAYERELVQQKGELERSNASLEQFAYAASHDLQSPLRAITHLAQWIGDDVKATASADTIDNLGLLTGRVARMQLLISGLLAYARVGRSQLVAEDVDVAAAVQDIVALLDPRPGFVVACEGDMPAIRTHRTPLELVLKNLINNGLQHHDRAEGRLGVAMRLRDGTAEIRISDDGPGIEKRYHDEIFVIFKTLQSRDETELGGIGLAMVKKQVTENGGRIWVESAPPARGSTFVFTWKLAPP